MAFQRVDDPVGPKPDVRSIKMVIAAVAEGGTFQLKYFLQGQQKFGHVPIFGRYGYAPFVQVGNHVRAG
jgi:hypothetical protein